MISGSFGRLRTGFRQNVETKCGGVTLTVMHQRPESSQLGG